MLISAILILLSLSSYSAFYLPGVAPKDYKKGTPVELHVNALSSADTVNNNLYNQILGYVIRYT
jgi:hypothetical protein